MIRQVGLTLLLLVIPVCAAAQTFFDDPAKQATLKAAINADPTMSAFSVTCCDAASGSAQLAVYLNALTSPAFIVWRTSVAQAELANVFMVQGSEFEGLTTGKHTALQDMQQWLGTGPINPSLAGVRTFFDGIFSGAGGQNTRAGLLVIYKRTARRVERIFATGTGSDAVPATLTFEGTVGAVLIQNIRSAP